MTGFCLKLIAIITMLIDHAGFVVFANNMTMRTIGRVAFPIFCFLLAEGADKTSNWKKYALRLLFFAVISEPVADYAFYGNYFYLGYQNVFWTLLLGLLAIECYKKCWDKLQVINTKERVLCTIGFLVCFIAAEFFCTDYGAFGIAMIMVIYIIKTRYPKDKHQNLVMSISIALLCIAYGGVEAFAAFAAVPIFFYNGKRGWNHPVMKYGFYAFYPIHLAVLALVREIIGIIVL
ncbi:MAG: TraX family protein [Lachnospiraceae bacterium]